MNSPNPDPAVTRQASSDQDKAAIAPVPQAVSAAENPLPAGPTDSPAAALGRRTLSTAFVQVGPDGLLTVKLHNGRALVLRNVVMRRKEYCGAHVSGGKVGAQFCGSYVDVASARPGGVPLTD